MVKPSQYHRLQSAVANFRILIDVGSNLAFSGCNLVPVTGIALCEFFNIAMMTRITER